MVGKNKVRIQITLSKDNYELLNELTKHLNERGENATKSDVIESALVYMVCTMRIKGQKTKEEN